MFHLGIDWASMSHAVCITDQDGAVVKQCKIDDDYDGYLTLLECLRNLSVENSEILFSIEDKNLKLVDFLLSHSFSGFFVPPASMESYRKRYSQNHAKSDASDAFILSDLLRTDRNNLKPIVKDSAFIRELSALLKDRDAFVKDCSRLTLRLISTLKEYYPEFLKLFKDPARDTALDFLIKFPTFQDASKLSFPRLYKFCTKRHFCQTESIKKIFSILKAKPTPVDEVVIKTKSIKAVATAKQIKELLVVISSYEEKISALFNSHPDAKIFSSLPRSGTITAAGLLTIFGDNKDKFASSDEVQMAVGTAPVTIQSGKFRIVKFRHGCNHFHRSVLHYFSMNSTRESIWAKNYLQTKLNQGKSFSCALRCLGYRWNRIIFSMWKNNTVYDENVLLANFAKQSIAADLSKNLSRGAGFPATA